MDNGRNWYLLTSKPKQDEKAEKQLLNQGYKIYRPLARRLRKSRGKMVERIESLFPRYIFIHLDLVEDNWFPIRSTIGVSDFVRFGGEPAKVPSEIVTTLKLQEDEVANKAIDLDRFKRGEKIIVNYGAFKGLQAVFECYEDGEQRSVVLLQMLGKMTKLTVDTVAIES